MQLLLLLVLVTGVYPATVEQQLITRKCVIFILVGIIALSSPSYMVGSTQAELEEDELENDNKKSYRNDNYELKDLSYGKDKAITNLQIAVV
ncbi:MAG: hypothetical protein ACR2F1_11660 [Nitrososphaeraceae archaeon]